MTRLLDEQSAGAGPSSSGDNMAIAYPFSGSPPAKLGKGLMPSVVVQDLKEALSASTDGKDE